ncbi:MAG: sensor histidine kinase [Desulfobacteraceae bacterium]|nr:MAG: sensor histidine kinase [Desulfobacteraceae bacterium]
MNQTASVTHEKDLRDAIEERKRIIFGELRERTHWFIRLRWFVPPGIVLGAVLADLLGFENLPIGSLAGTAVFIAVYNAVFYLIGRKKSRGIGQRGYIRNLTRWQFALDYVSIFLLIHFTGGIGSPLIFFLFFHIIFASILLPVPSSYGFATLVVFGMAAISVACHTGWLTPYSIAFRGRSLDFSGLPFHMAMILGFFVASVYITAFFTSSIMGMLRKRISNLVDLSENVRGLNEKMNALYAVIQAVGTVKKLDFVLKMVTSELCQVMGVLGISVKLLSPDGKFLHYVSAEGLVAGVFRSKVVEVAKSPLNRQIIEGKPYVTGKVNPGEMFQFGEDLAAANVESVLFVPLIAEEKVIGILGAYCKYQERFSPDEVEFFRQAAGLVAVAIENVRAYESIEKIMEERRWFMMRVAHNLRSPLAAVISILDVVRGGYQGPLNENQSEYLRRVDRRVHTMLTMINELLALAKSREERRKISFEPMDLSLLAGRIQRTFQDEARQKGLNLEILVGGEIPFVDGNPEMVEQVLENLVSNGIKYTPPGGKVRVEFSRGPKETVQIQIADTGIGIPQRDRQNLFKEFFRAENARMLEEHGTGLGLAMVKEVVDQLGGRITVESEEGLGTLFVIQLPKSGKTAKV